MLESRHGRPNHVGQSSHDVTDDEERGRVVHRVQGGIAEAGEIAECEDDARERQGRHHRRVEDGLPGKALAGQQVGDEDAEEECAKRGEGTIDETVQEPLERHRVRGDKGLALADPVGRAA